MKLEIVEIKQIGVLKKIDSWFMIELPKHQTCYHANAQQVKAVKASIG